MPSDHHSPRPPVYVLTPEDCERFRAIRERVRQLAAETREHVARTHDALQQSRAMLGRGDGKPTPADHAG